MPPIILQASVEDEVLSVSFDAAVGRTYAVETANVLGVEWTVLTNITAPSTNVVFSHSITNFPEQFYHVVMMEN